MKVWKVDFGDSKGVIYCTGYMMSKAVTRMAAATFYDQANIYFYEQPGETVAKLNNKIVATITITEIEERG